MQNTSASRRPFGIGIIVLLLIIQAIIEIAAGTFTYIGTPMSPLAKVLAGWSPLVVAILVLILAWALWRLAPWAYWV